MPDDTMSDDTTSEVGDDSPQPSWSVDSLGNRYDAMLSWSSSLDLLNRQPIVFDIGDLQEDRFKNGVAMQLPNGRLIEDPWSWTGYLMGPTGVDLANVAKSGRILGAAVTAVEATGNSMLAQATLHAGLGLSLGHAGFFDYQREGSYLFGYTQHRQFRDISNVNVGLFAQQAGLPIEEILEIAGQFASLRSSNAMPNKPYSLDPRNTYLIELGYRLGSSGIFERSEQGPRP
ncbi:hypothetical protein [Rhizobium leguminosarum]|uniref:hypothetical protein n=1 Tax=Rhizobium leguminosarum TaxID=384 RepID=UPI003CFEA2E5